MAYRLKSWTVNAVMLQHELSNFNSRPCFWLLSKVPCFVHLAPSVPHRQLICKVSSMGDIFQLAVLELVRKASQAKHCHTIAVLDLLPECRVLADQFALTVCSFRFHTSSCAIGAGLPLDISQQGPIPPNCDLASPAYLLAASRVASRDSSSFPQISCTGS